MKYLGAYLLATLGGNAAPTAKDILAIVESVGLDCDMEEANKIVSALGGKDIKEVITEGKKKISSVPSGAAPAAAGGAAPAAAAAAPAAAKKEEPQGESDEDFGMDLFG